MTQSSSLKDQLKALESLQEIDLKIDQLKKTKNDLPGTLRTLDTQLAQAKAAVDAKKKAFDEIEKTAKQSHAALDLNKDRMARSTSRLEGVKNTQEFQAANKEIDQLTKLNAQLQEQLKRSDADGEAFKKDIENLSASFDKLQGERDAQVALVSGQNSKLDEEINLIMKERHALAKQVPMPILTRYDRVRGARAGLGIVAAIGGRCKGCNMVVPPQLYNMVQKALELQACPSCHRILFMPASAETNDQGSDAEAVSA